jgi:diaminohydroxyphosphoribosylaminopyrimidine deaminase/5-amino-6-(5-phosphoribosylamino)uracil reductase
VVDAAGPAARTDDELMRRALALAERGRGRTSPNPLVGALVVAPDGVIVGTGYHERAGEPHAEIHALRAAGARARGATLYCSLEPCCHSGRTGPCALAIVEAGVARVVAAVEDPNPRVAGGGVRYLRDRGIAVTVGVRQADARRLNEVFETNMRRRRPFVTLKVAMSLDGKVASAPRARTAITSGDANRHAQRVRAEVDGIAVGSETVLIDDPLLTVRDVYRDRPLARIVFDTRLRTPPSARLFRTRDVGPVFIVTSEAAAREHGDRARALLAAGADLIPNEPYDLRGAMASLLDRGITSVLVEGGPRLHAAVWTAGVVDRVRCYVAPTALGPDGVPWSMPSSFSLGGLTPVRAETLGVDVLLEADVHRVD